MNSPSAQKLIKQFLKFPTVGPRTAARFVSYLINEGKEEIEALIKSIQQIRQEVKLCSFCFNPFEGKSSLCEICSSANREKTLLCVVEKEIDLTAIEKTKKYKGLYFILAGTIATLKKAEVEKLRTKELPERIKNPAKFGVNTAKWNEIILAFNPTVEGEATRIYLEKLLKPLGVKITRLGRGLPAGAELEYADEETLEGAFEARK